MNIQKILGETIAGAIAALHFLGSYFGGLLLLTFRPRKFVTRFLSVTNGRRRLRASSLFLFTTILILELSVGILDRIMDATNIHGCRCGSASTIGNYFGTVLGGSAAPHHSASNCLDGDWLDFITTIRN